jgi:hypothetical protein
LRLDAKKVGVEVGCKEAGLLGWLQYAEIEAGKPKAPVINRGGYRA